MALMDEFREERATIKNAPLTTKIAYVWHYYKWHIIIPLTIISFLTWYIVYMITKPDIILEGIFLNTNNMEATTLSEELATEFCEQHKINTKDYEVNLNTTLSFNGDDLSDTANYETTQVLMAWVGAGTIDFIAGDQSALTVLAYKDYLVDLRDVLSKDDLEKYEPYFLYIDEAVLYAEDSSTPSTEIEEIQLDYPDSTKPEEMERPIPVLIDISASEKITELYSGVTPVVLGVAVKAPNTETLSDFLNFIDK